MDASSATSVRGFASCTKATGFLLCPRTPAGSDRAHDVRATSGFCVDPIEKKPLNHFLPGTPVLSFGTAGCNLGCKFCQNWDISKSREMDTWPTSLARGDRPARQLGCRSVAFTYNDPVIFDEYAIDVAKPAAKAASSPSP